MYTGHLTMNTINIWLQQVETRVISQVVQYGADCETVKGMHACMHAGCGLHLRSSLIVPLAWACRQKRARRGMFAHDVLLTCRMYE
jgi:hypothetical protein